MKSRVSSSTRVRKREPKIGLALGSGSARGLAHIGVIRAIEESGINVDVVAGSSIGALIGAVYASGRLDAIERAFRSIDWRTLGSFFDPVFPKSGLIDGRKIAEFTRTHLTTRYFKQLPIPFCAVAVDIMSGEEVILSDGDLIEAIRASISVPGIFTPVCHNARILVDGGLVDPVPVSAARALGADVVIAIDLNHDIVIGKRHRRGARRGRMKKTVLAKLDARRLRSSSNPALNRIRGWLDKEPLPGMVETMLASLYIMQARITESRLQIERPEVLIRPPLSSIHLLEFDRADEIIAIGYRSAVGPIRELARRLPRSRHGA
jgi:NTE family protein